MNKELNILQAIEMPVGTIFKGINTFNKEREVVIKENKGRKKLFVINKNVEPKEIELNDFTAKFKFIPIQKPVSFIEALKEYSEHKKTIYSVTGTGTKRFYRFDKAGLNSNGEHISAFEILDCDWYIEEEN